MGGHLHGHRAEAGPRTLNGPPQPAEPAGPGDRVVRVAPDIPAIHRRFDYSAPPTLGPDLRVGSRVRVELHGRRVGAWVVEDGVEPRPGCRSNRWPRGAATALRPKW